MPVVVGIAIGVLAGLGVFTFGYARGAAYLTDDPAACANCHVMREQYAGWLKSSHRQAAVCNDCHTPPGFPAKYGVKALNGMFHSWAFTTGWFPDEIRITARNRGVTERACLKCHQDMVSTLAAARGHRQKQDCILCHAHPGHQ